VAYLATMPAAQVMVPNDSMEVSNELEGMWKETTMAT
jgi:hypothetical protein